MSSIYEDDQTPLFLSWVTTRIKGFREKIITIQNKPDSFSIKRYILDLQFTNNFHKIFFFCSHTKLQIYTFCKNCGKPGRIPCIWLFANFAGGSTRRAGEDLPLGEDAQLHVPHDRVLGQDAQVLGHAQLRAHDDYEPVRAMLLCRCRKSDNILLNAWENCLCLDYVPTNAACTFKCQFVILVSTNFCSRIIQWQW